MTHQSKFHNMNYLVKYPKNYDTQKAYPVIMIINGAGSRGNDAQMLYDSLFFDITDKFEDFPFITVTPQCYTNTWFDIFETLIEFTKHIYNCPFTDKTRLYGMGGSMGGYALWQLAMSVPELFAAIVPICGGGMYWNAGRLINVPVWAFHGDSDPVVFPEESVKMVNAINNCGGNAKITIYENCDHDSWTATYSNKEVYKWLLSNTKKSVDVAQDNYKDSKKYG